MVFTSGADRAVVFMRELPSPSCRQELPGRFLICDQSVDEPAPEGCENGGRFRGPAGDGHDVRDGRS